jgi:hypothetical protein
VALTPTNGSPSVGLQAETKNPYKLTFVGVFSRTQRVPPLQGLYTGSRNVGATRPTTFFCPRCGSVTSGLVLANAGLHPKRRLSAARFVTQAREEVLGQIGADIPDTCSSLVLACSFGKRAGLQEQPGGNGATQRGHDKNAPAEPEPLRRSRGMDIQGGGESLGGLTLCVFQKVFRVPNIHTTCKERRKITRAMQDTHNFYLL